jgi:hypothetical protein
MRYPCSKNQLFKNSQSLHLIYIFTDVTFKDIGFITFPQGVAARAILRNICQTVGQLRQSRADVQGDPK